MIYIYITTIIHLFWCTFAVADYVPPTGIPAPDFGIDQVHTTYSGQTYIAGSFVYRDAGNGPYTHYVDNSGTCTDTANTYGTVASPRCTIPTTIPEGSVVELHGGPYGGLSLDGVVGTAEKPIFIRGTSSTSRVSISGAGVVGNAIYVIDSSYIIIENIKTDGTGLTGDTGNAGFVVKSPSDHISMRHSESTGYPAPDYCEELERACWFGALWSVGAGDDGAAPTSNVVSNIVFYNNSIHNNSDTIWPPTYETGRHGIMVTSGSEDIWILNNTITRSGDDGVQVYWAATGVKGPPAERVYIGKNTIHDMGENAVDIKQSYDVIISQNTFYDFTATTQIGAGSDGSAIVLNNDDPSDRLWVIFNEIFESNIGIRSQAHGDVYIIGNIIHDIVRASGYNPPLSALQSGTAITTAASPSMNVVGNTINRIDGGIYITLVLESVNDVSNNIISNLNESTGYTIYQNSGTLLADHNLMYSTNGNITLKKTTCTNCLTAQDPLFIQESADNYHIDDLSPAIGAGDLSTAYDDFFTLYGIDILKDYSGAHRPTNITWDIGAYEYQPTHQFTRTGTANLRTGTGRFYTQ